MTTMARNGLVIAGLHVALVGSLGAKLVYDRATLPRVWVRTAPVDPNDPIRGRYVRLRLEVTLSPGVVLPERRTETLPDGRTMTYAPPPTQVELKTREGRLEASAGKESNDLFVDARDRNGQRVVVLLTPVAYFIPEKVPDPSIRAAGEELWVEVTLPRRGLPRPIRLGVKKDGVLTPIDLR